MPGFDRTGPEGQGSKTGRGLGKCNPNRQTTQQSSEEERSFGAGKGRRKHNRGFGRGQGRGIAC